MKMLQHLENVTLRFQRNWVTFSRPAERGKTTLLPARRSSGRRRRGALLAIAIVALGCWIGESAAFAQNAQVTGLVKDQSGAIMPGVTVTATNRDTGFARTAVTDDRGEYRLPALTP